MTSLPIDPRSLLAKIVERVCVRVPSASRASVALKMPDDYLEVQASYGVTGPVRGRVAPVGDTFQMYPLESARPEVDHLGAQSGSWCGHGTEAVGQDFIAPGA
jgi:hypothetical protein